MAYEPRIKDLAIRGQDSEALIDELPGTQSRDQIQLVANAAGYPPNCILAKFTSGANAGKWGRWDAAQTATDGSQIARGFLYQRRRASTTQTTRATAITRSAELDGKKVNYGTTDADKIATCNAQLLSMDTTNRIGGIRVRY